MTEPTAPIQSAPRVADAAAEPPAPAGPRPEAHVVRLAEGEVTVAARDAVTVASEADSIVLTAATEIVLSVGQSSLTLRADGTVLINGRRMTLNAPAMIALNPDDPDQGPPGEAPNTTAEAAPAPRPCGCRGARRAASGDAPGEASA